MEREGALITAVRVDVDGEPRRVGCQVVIDGSDRGDLLPLAEVPFRFGWEAQEQWNEPSAPSRARLEAEPFFSEHPLQSPTWVVMGQLQSDHLEADPARTIGSSALPQLPAPFERACEAFGLERTLTYGRLPGGLVMLNWPLHGNDWHWGLSRAFGADPKQEAALYEEMQAHSLRFAEALMEASDGWLQLGHAFPAESGSPAPWLAAMPYWREGRRFGGARHGDRARPVASWPGCFVRCFAARFRWRDAVDRGGQLRQRPSLSRAGLAPGAKELPLGWALDGYTVLHPLRRAGERGDRQSDGGRQGDQHKPHGEWRHAAAAVGVERGSGGGSRCSAGGGPGRATGALFSAPAPGAVDQ